MVESERIERQESLRKIIDKWLMQNGQEDFFQCGELSYLMATAAMCVFDACDTAANEKEDLNQI